MSKQERVQHLMKHWQENDGVDKALEKIVQDARKGELSDMENSSLLELCQRAGVDPYVKEVIVDRVIKKEVELGRFNGPKPDKEEIADSATRTGDMVDSLIASEAARK